MPIRNRSRPASGFTARVGLGYCPGRPLLLLLGRFFRIVALFPPATILIARTWFHAALWTGHIRPLMGSCSSISHLTSFHGEHGFANDEQSASCRRQISLKTLKEALGLF